MKGVIFLFTGAFFFVSLVPSVFAATLYLSPNSTSLNRGDSIKISMRLDVDQDECINAIDGVVHYSENIEPVDISRGASIMSIWVEEPIINRAEHTITFAGGIPNGYCGRIIGDPRLTNNIVDMVFQSPGFVVGNKQGTSSDQANIDITDATTVYLNDGFGSMAPLNRFGTTIALASRAGTTTLNQWGDIVDNDVLPPEQFSIALEQTKNAFSNQYFITFNTTDKQSGIDHYEVIEEPLKDFWSFSWGRTDAPWEEVRSPFVLNDQSLNSTIRVRAIDKAGNEYIASLVPDASKRSFTNVMWLMIGGALLIIILFVTLLTLFIRHRRKTSVAPLPLTLDEEADLTYDDGNDISEVNAEVVVK